MSRDFFDLERKAGMTTHRKRGNARANGADDDPGFELRIGRRQLLKGSGAALLVASAGPVVLFAGRIAGAAGTDFSSAYFADQIGSVFQVDAGASGWSALELVDVARQDVSPALDQFTVRFRSPGGLALAEDVYVVAPPGGETFELQLQPRGEDGSGAYYDATFALIRPIHPACAGAA